MRVEDTINHFAEAIVLMVGTFPYVEDIFFVKKIRGKVDFCIRIHQVVKAGRDC